MTDQEKLQKLFQAALQDSSELNKAPTRAFPTATSVPAAASVPAAMPFTQPVPVAPAPEPVAVAAVVEEAPVVLPSNAGLDDKTSTELGSLLDEQRARLARKRRRDTLVVLGVMFALGGSGFGWFVQDPQRVQAFKDAIRDVRSIGDVKSMVAKYRESLDKVAVRGKQIEQATDAMGVVRTAADEEDPYFEDEMKGMMGGKGKTVGERNKAMKDNFGHMQKEHGVHEHDKAGAPEKDTKLKEEQSFSWDK
ncbi:MAG: hypothetical protein EOP88_19055 [Verrucomicrobiaceae bacterium]|nr:MAG: hypothetical protein EOP88_19055 [Verrucomicrobiaceae bacterium]